MPLCTHNGAGDVALGLSAPGGYALLAYETMWLGRRGLWQVIFGGVLERHPRFKFVLAEQGVTWVKETLRELDSIRRSPIFTGLHALAPDLPSDYWQRQCFLIGSFLARHEVAARNDAGGTSKIMWGSDYPHMEGTWPNTID
jgi:predicted TIM-barrel fold metal-dependent hydrolase